MQLFWLKLRENIFKHILIENAYVFSLIQPKFVPNDPLNLIFKRVWLSTWFMWWEKIQMFFY